MIRVYLLLFILGTLGGIGYTAYSYYVSTQATIAQLRENNTKLEMAAETLQNTVDTMKQDAERTAALTQELSKKLQQAESGLDRLRNRLSEINLTQEALTDPANLEQRINSAVERLINDIEKDTTFSDDSDTESDITE
jgi:chromosome segregation ATPase